MPSRFITTRRLALAVSSLAAVAFGCPAWAQNTSIDDYKQGTIGFKRQGNTHYFGGGIQGTRTMVPLGYFDANSKTWVSQPRKLMTGEFGTANLGSGSTIGPVLETDGTVTMFGPNKPANGTWITNDSSLKCEPILGPFHPAGSDLTRCGTARYITTTKDENVGEYGTLLNMESNGGFPTQCQRSKYYPEFSNCLNDGKMYRVKYADRDANGNITKTYYGTTAASGTGPTGTDPNLDQVDGGVTWRYEPFFTPSNGGKVNFSLMSYQGPQSGTMWNTAMAHQIAGGGPKKTAFTMELDLNNYWGDYATDGPAGPAATALQIFTGGPFRSSKAIGIGQYESPGAGHSALVNGIELCCASLISDNTIYDLTSSRNGYLNLGKHSGSTFTDGSNSAISFNSYGGADVGFRHAGTSAVGLQLQGAYNFFQVQGQGWTVNPAGVVTSSGSIVNGDSSATGTATVGTGLTVNTGAFKPAKYTVATLFPCIAATDGSVIYITDLAQPSTFKQTGFTGGGNNKSLAVCNGTSWELH
ncbi:MULTISPECIES: hypothetical protein [Methylorubrum]|uniref:hypothetical protein n=1 Tax=Methylorubrum TaxID=2282523 RepID=UPI00209E19A3|nr:MULTISPECIES: hypothetical protein [Methylorubrum]MCP1551638.1 hypothetical protein [Methylorubrum zatmanii]MCP1556605.1 hypothetical protein [Methylorubrum extorquens]MCP1581973.1 hypothetical protein [Methylorubrum extorquens]